jgi:hypothetical protein
MDKKASILSDGTIVSRSPRVAHRLFEDRMLVITVDDSRLHRLNEVGTYIWGQLESPKSVRELSALVMENFSGCTKEAARTDTADFVGKMSEKGLVTLSDRARDER